MPVYQPIDLDELIQHANSLEPLPASATQLASILSQDEWDLDDVIPVVSLDQGLTGKLLSVANSVASGAQDPVVTVEQAVVRLGAGQVLALAIGTGLRARTNVALPEYGLDEGELWDHSVASAIVAEGLRGYTQRRIPLEAATAALLHDIGKLVLARYLDTNLQHYIKLARESGGLSEQRAEIEILGVNHAELGGLIAQHWNLPSKIVEGVTYHHTPQDAYFDHQESLIAHAVHLSNTVAHFVTDEEAPLPENSAGLAASKIRLGLARKDFERMCYDMRERFIDVASMYG
ncbi:MAG: HDOD domain-containing protein [Planctomycetes bacterium]|nr:HDOD domain-containing protein [Planctomycetota bacterium]